MSYLEPAAVRDAQPRTISMSIHRTCIPTTSRRGSARRSGRSSRSRVNLIETWRADPEGRFRDADDPGAVAEWFRGFGRSGAEPAGEWGILTVKPGPTTTPDGAVEGPHVDVRCSRAG